MIGLLPEYWIHPCSQQIIFKYVEVRVRQINCIDLHWHVKGGFGDSTNGGTTQNPTISKSVQLPFHVWNVIPFQFSIKYDGSSLLLRVYQSCCVCVHNHVDDCEQSLPIQFVPTTVLDSISFFPKLVQGGSRRFHLLQLRRFLRSLNGSTDTGGSLKCFTLPHALWSCYAAKHQRMAQVGTW